MANNTVSTTPPSITSTVFSAGTSAILTLTDGLQFDGTSAFSLGAWLLIEPGNAAGDLFSAGTNFAISISESGTIQGNIGATAWVLDNSNVPVSRWFYLLVTVVASTNGSPAVVSLYLDGALADTVSVNTMGGGTDTQLTIGGAAFQCTALSVWNATLLGTDSEYIQPNWTPPSTASNIVAAVDFTQNPPVDTGPSHCAISYADAAATPYQMCNTPALYFNGAASAYLTSPDAVVPNGKFSLGLWCYIEMGAVFENQITILQVCDADGAQTLTLSLTVPTPGTAALFVATSAHGNAQTTPYSLPVQSWTAIGVNFDSSKNKLFLSVNGSVVHSTGFQGFSKPLTSLNLGVTQVYADTQNFAGYIQTFFTIPDSLSAAQIYALQTSGIPASQTCSCVLQFGGAETYDQVTGASVVLNQARSISNQTAYWQVNTGTTQALGQRTVKSPIRPVIPQPAPPWFASASSNNPDILGYNLEIYDQLMSALPVGARKTRLRQLFQQKLQEGFDRAKIGDWLTPKVQCELINGKYRFSLSKPSVENDVFDIDATSISPCTAWTIQVAAQCICIMLQLFGFAYVLSGIVKVMSTSLQNLQLARNMPFYQGPSNVGAIINILNEDKTVGASTIIKIVQTLYNANLLLPCILNGLAGVSWWSWAFIVAGLMVSIAGIWVTGGWYLAVMLAQLAVSVAQLVVLVNERPTGC